MSDILVFAEYQDGKVKKTTLELLSKACELAKATGGKVSALLIGNNIGELSSSLSPYQVSQVIVVQNSKLEKYNSMAYSQVLSEVLLQMKPTIVLGTASPVGKDIFPRVAAKVQAGLATECIDLQINEGKLVAKKPIYSGKVFVDVQFTTAIQMATTRPNSFATLAPNPAHQAEVIHLSIEPVELRAPLKEIIRGAADKADLTEAEVIVAGGRAMGSNENFKILRELADVIGATVGASRAAVDSGYASHDMQVGQTGKVVNPKLYIACGISGAIQNLSGMRTSKVIVAVNKDPEAPIFAKADYGIVGDLFTVVPQLTLEFKKLLSE